MCLWCVLDVVIVELDADDVGINTIDDAACDVLLDVLEVELDSVETALEDEEVGVEVLVVLVVEENIVDDVELEDEDDVVLEDEDDVVLEEEEDDEDDVVAVVDALEEEVDVDTANTLVSTTLTYVGADTA